MLVSRNKIDFIRDHVEKKNIKMKKIHTDKQKVNILTKPLVEARFRDLWNWIC